MGVAATEPAPSTVRAEVLAQHVTIRRRLRTVHRAALRVLDSGTGMTTLRDEVLRLAAELSAHLAFEERTLAPLLGTLDAWGELRRERLLDEHARQRAELEAMTASCEQGTPSTLRRFALQVRRLVENLVDDMEAEEATLLHVDLLRDDLIVIDQSAG
jgi:hypothetical protein